MWNLDRGFLPADDPYYGGFKEYPTNSNLLFLETLAQDIPGLIERRAIREEIVARLRIFNLPISDYSEQTDQTTEWMMRLYSYFASAYVYARGEEPATRLPREIAAPFCELAKKLKRPPILSYASYCLYNWRRLNLSKPIVLGNIELINRFCSESAGARDEAWFILVHVDIEAKAAKAVQAVSTKITEQSYQDVLMSLIGMNATLARMPEECSPENYFRFVRPYIFGFKNIRYESFSSFEPKTLRGETGAQSSIVPMLLGALGIVHRNTMLTQHLSDMRAYMPEPHQRFLESVGQICQTNGNQTFNMRVVAHQEPKYRELYNSILNELIRFRKQHFQYAVDYIEKKVANPEGTGGTPYVPWLGQLIEETKEYFL